jgi:oligopeptide transport system substrate-binding protein
MSKRMCLVLVLIVGILILIGAACAATGYFMYFQNGGMEEHGPQGKASSATRPERPAAQGGGTLRLSGNLPPTLDPAVVQDSTSAEYIVHLFSGLVTLNDDLEPAPDLAERWEIGDDGRTYTFYLVTDAAFSDGRPITAEDVVYSLERALRPETGSPVAGDYLGDIVGAADLAAGRTDRLEGVRIIDEYTLEIRIDEPKAYFLSKLTYPTAFVVDREQIEAEGERWMQRPNASGPFVLETLSRERVVLARNEYYHGEAPALDRVEYIISGGIPMTMYENDLLDIVNVPAFEVDRVADPHNPLYAEHRINPELSVQYLAFDVETPPFDDVAVRQAIAHAIDKERIANLVLRGTALPVAGILPPGMPGHDPDLQGLEYDPERARELLAGSRYGEPGAMPEIVLTISGTSGYMDGVTRAVVAMLEENLGIDVMVEQVEWSHFLRDLTARRYAMFSSGWIADYPDAQNFLDLLFHSKSTQNRTGYANERVDELLERARVEADDDRRLALYRQAEEIIVNDAPWVPLSHGVTHTLVKPYVRGFTSSAGLYPWLKDVYLEL